MKSELHLLRVSDMEKCYKIDLNFGGWPFSITVRGTSGKNLAIEMREYNWNQSTEEYKRYSMKGWAAFYDQPLLSYGCLSRTSSAVYWIKRTNKDKIFHQKTSFDNLLKLLKVKVPNTKAADLS